MVEGCALWLAAAAYEFGLFAAIVFAIFGMEDLAVDALFLSRVADPPFRAPDVSTPLTRDFALYVPAWAEGPVIGAMLAHCTATWPSSRLRIYIGVYPNDLATMAAVSQWAARDRRIHMVVNRRPGPTSKGDCLNSIWRRHCQDRPPGAAGSDAVLLQDAEDVVDPAALVTFDHALRLASYAQLPVIPLMSAGHHWVRGHYGDEFAEAHGKELPVRAALGAPLPTAGVGCAFTMEALARIAGPEGPFASDSLTEDYEVGLRLGGVGARGVFVRAHADDGRIVGSRGLFPKHINAAVRQKTRWLRGNALEGWTRIGWPCPPGASFARTVASVWMLWRDRRAMLAAIAVLAGYMAIILGVTALALAAVLGISVHVVDPDAWLLVSFNLLLLVWRLAVRSWFCGRMYGLGQAALAVVRQLVSNIILIMTAQRALAGHWAGLRGTALAWDKTDHHFPELSRIGTVTLEIHD